MTASSKALGLIRFFEGCKLEAYRCPSGLWTCGYGHTAGVHEGMKIDAPQAEALLRADVAEFEAAVRRAVKVPLTQGQFDALVSFAFNCREWRTSTLIRKVNQGDYAGAAAEFPKWVHSGDKVLPGLTARRAAEKALFLSDTRRVAA